MSRPVIKRVAVGAKEDLWISQAVFREVNECGENGERREVGSKALIVFHSAC